MPPIFEPFTPLVVQYVPSQDAIRFHVKNSLYALLVTYLRQGTRDILTYFNTSWTSADRVVVQDGVTFPIVVRLPGEEHEIPGVNLVMYDEIPLGDIMFSRLATIHVYSQVSRNSQADERIVLKLLRKLDEALYPGGIDIIIFSESFPAIAQGRTASWVYSPKESWLELTDLQANSFVHKSRNLRVVYRDIPIDV